MASVRVAKKAPKKNSSKETQVRFANQMQRKMVRAKALVKKDEVEKFEREAHAADAIVDYLDKAVGMIQEGARHAE